jgi:hypothetical protein
MPKATRSKKEKSLKQTVPQLPKGTVLAFCCCDKILERKSRSRRRRRRQISTSKSYPQ